MKSMLMRCFIVCFLLTLPALRAVAAPAHVIHVQLHDRTRGQGTIHDTTVVMTREALRIDLKPFLGRSVEAIYRAQRSELVLVDHTKKAYVSLDMEALATAGGALGSLDGFLREAIGDLAGRRAPREGLRIERVREFRRISGVICQKVTLWEGDLKSQDLWACSYSELGMDSGDFSVLRQLIWEADRTAPVLDRLLGTEISLVRLDGILRVNGFPVMIRQSSGGKVFADIRLAPPSQVESKPSDFAVPSSYRSARPNEWRALVRGTR